MPKFSRGTANLNFPRSSRASIGLGIGGMAFSLSILPSLIVGHTVSEQLKVDVGQSLANLAYQMTDKLDREMYERYHELQVISTLKAVRDPNFSVSEQRTLLEKLKSTYTNYAWIGFADNQGIVQVSTGKLLEGKSVSQQPWFINGQKAPYVGDMHEAFHLASSSREPLHSVHVAVPVIDLQGNPRGVLGANLSWTWFQEGKNSLLHPLQGLNNEMFILNQNGKLLLGPLKFDAQPSAEKPALFLPLASVKAAGRGVNNYLIETWSDGHTYLTGFARSIGYRSYPGLGWLVLVRQKTDVTFAPAQRLQQQIFGWNLILGALFAVLGWLIYTPTEQEKNLKATNQKLQLELTKRRQAEEAQRLSSECKSSFIAQASHDFRTPLTAINISAEILEKFSHKATDEQKSRYLAQIKLAVIRLTQLLDEVLLIGKAEAGKLEFKPAPLDVVNFCRALAEELQLGAGTQYQLTFVTEGYCTEVCLDENLLRHILTNLLSNAIKYSPQGGEVQFKLICDQDVVFCIQDHGIGIPAADRAKLFTSFYRCSNTGNLPGTGLGLAIVKEAVDVHGGQITFESKVGVGTTFTVKLPLNSTQKLL